VVFSKKFKNEVFKYLFRWSSVQAIIIEVLEVVICEILRWLYVRS